jgi:predicted AAA+ superfamily ATPase
MCKKSKMVHKILCNCVSLQKKEVMDVTLTRIMDQRVNAVSKAFKRYMYGQINWERQMLGLVGPRGVGKTTLFLQYIHEHHSETKMFYVSADNVYFSSHSLIDVADQFVREGGKHLFIDEIHKYGNWSQELKQIYDDHPDLRVSFTGSSILDITHGEADLSRRAPIYRMQGLSFREYLALFHGLSFPVATLDDVLSCKVQLPGVSHPLPWFHEYLQHGYYPFGRDPQFEMILNQIVEQTMDIDIPQFAKMTVSTGRKLRHLLSIIAKSVPFKPVMDSLATVVSVSRNVLPDYFVYMEKAGMIGQLRDDTGGIRGLGKVEKVYLDNTNLAYVMGGVMTDIGNIRETFFYNQIRVVGDVIASRTADFEIGDIMFEVGGKNKNSRQIKHTSNAYIVKDDLEIGAGNQIPLWTFGMTY